MISRSGSTTAMARGLAWLRSSRTTDSSRPRSTTELLFATPTRSVNARSASGVKPRRRMPLTVGMRGSFQPSTWASSTSRRR